MLIIIITISFQAYEDAINRIKPKLTELQFEDNVLIESISDVNIKPTRLLQKMPVTVNQINYIVC